jgi:hypothetical protein
MADSSGKDYDDFAKAFRCLYKSIEMTWWRHPNEKTEGPETPGKVASGGPERRWNDCFYLLFLVSKQIVNGCFLLCFISVQD